jgi:hypothetical protein
VEDGEEKLRKAQLTLDDAKAEAQSTLAPILERMKNSRKIKNAEKVLKRMAHLLEFPYKMRVALDRGDLSDVVAIYQRIQSMPSTSTLRILNRVKEAADNVISDLKSQCMEVLLDSNTDYMKLLRYGKLILDIDGSHAYGNVLRKCFLRRIATVVASVRQLKRKFVVEAFEAYKSGQDLNLIRQNSIVRDVGLDGVYDAENALAIRKQINSSRRGNFTSNTSNLRLLGGPTSSFLVSASTRDVDYYTGADNESVYSDGNRRPSIQRDEFDLYDDDTDEEMMDLESMLEDGE